MNDIPPASSRSRAISPFRDLAEPFGWLRGEIDRLFDDFPSPERALFGSSTRALKPALEMTRDDKGYRLTVELPGLSEKDVEIGLADGVLTVSGEKKEETGRKEKGVLLSERRFGSFRRQVALPDDVDPDKITAQFKDGVLTVTLARDDKAPPRSRKIAIEKA